MKRLVVSSLLIFGIVSGVWAFTSAMIAVWTGNERWTGTAILFFMASLALLISSGASNDMMKDDR